MFRDVLKLKPILQKVAAEKAAEKKIADFKKFSSKKCEEKSIRTLDKFKLKRKFQFKHLETNALQDYKAFFTGNAPEIVGLEKYKQENKKIALIALSGMRALLIACQLGCKTKDKIPKIFLIENSRQVCQLWYKIRDFASEHKSEESFLKAFENFLTTHKVHFRERNKTAFDFIKTLFTNFGFDYVRSIICHTSIIKQSWADKNTFLKLRNILNYLEINTIYSFPSNLISLKVNKNMRNSILANLALVKPHLSIHTNLHPQLQRPDKVFLIDENKSLYTKEMIFPETSCNIL